MRLLSHTVPTSSPIHLREHADAVRAAHHLVEAARAAPPTAGPRRRPGGRRSRAGCRGDTGEQRRARRARPPSRRNPGRPRARCRSPSARTSSNPATARGEGAVPVARAVRPGRDRAGDRDVGERGEVVDRPPTRRAGRRRSRRTSRRPERPRSPASNWSALRHGVQRHQLAGGVGEVVERVPRPQRADPRCPCNQLLQLIDDSPARAMRSQHRCGDPTSWRPASHHHPMPYMAMNRYSDIPSRMRITRLHPHETPGRGCARAAWRARAVPAAPASADATQVRFGLDLGGLVPEPGVPFAVEMTAHNEGADPVTIEFVVPVAYLEQFAEITVPRAARCTTTRHTSSDGRRP